MATMSKPKKTDEEQAQSRENLRNYLAEAVDKAQGEPGFKAWLKTRSTMVGVRMPITPGGKKPAPYSINNQLIIAFVLGATAGVAGKGTWFKHGRKLKKGAKGTWLIKSGQYHDKDDAGNRLYIDGSGATTTTPGPDTKPLFRRFLKWSHPVFKYEDTEPVEGAKVVTNLDAPISEPEEGDSHAYLLPTLEAYAAAEGATVSYQELDDSYGGYVDASGNIVINSKRPVNAQVKTLIHELAHHVGGVDYQKYSRADAEVIVESVAFIVSAGVGLQSEYSVGYCAIWDSRKKDGKDPYKEFLYVIDGLARKIEGAIYDFAVRTEADA